MYACSSTAVEGVGVGRIPPIEPGPSHLTPQNPRFRVIGTWLVREVPGQSRAAKHGIGEPHVAACPPTRTATTRPLRGRAVTGTFADFVTETKHSEPQGPADCLGVLFFVIRQSALGTRSPTFARAIRIETMTITPAQTRTTERLQRAGRARLLLRAPTRGRPSQA